MLKIYKEDVTSPYSQCNYKFWAFWNDLEKEAKTKDNDVRCAAYVLKQLKIRNTKSSAWIEDDNKGWRVAWS